MRKKISVALIVALLMLSLTIALCMIKTERSGEEPQNQAINNQSVTLSLPKEMRGLWVSYITLDMSDTDRSFESFKNKFNKIISDAKEFGCNTVIVQVRPFSDALYESEVYPSSHVLSGIQGVSCGYDALEYMCESAHDAGLMLHAWVNPYRVSTGSTPQNLSKSNPYYYDESISFETESGRYLNPAKKAARGIIIKGLVEIAENYDVDGIQFDDYFYPADCGNFDADDYNTYKKSTKNITKAMTLIEWRQNNVNLLISEAYLALKSTDADITFGIAPQGNMDNDYNMGADVKAWCASVGYADYICPQMYYSINNPALSFEDSLKEWSKLDYHRDIKVYVGLGAYKAGTDADAGTWLDNIDELKKQLALLRQYGFDGYMIYDYSALCSEEAKETLDVFREAI